MKSPATVKAYVATVRRYAAVAHDGAGDPVRRYLAARAARLAPASVNAEISALHSWFGYLVHIDPGHGSPTASPAHAPPVLSASSIPWPPVAAMGPSMPFARPPGTAWIELLQDLPPGRFYWLKEQGRANALPRDDALRNCCGRGCDAYRMPSAFDDEVRG